VGQFPLVTHLLSSLIRSSHWQAVFIGTGSGAVRPYSDTATSRDLAPMRSERRWSSSSPSGKFLHRCDISTCMKAPGAQSAPEIVENYPDYVPPAKLMNWVENLLESVPKNYLAGLKTIVLTNHSTLTRDQRRQKVWQRGRKLKLARVRGAYYRATRSRPAVVWLYVDNIFRSQPAWTLRVPFLATFALRRSCITKSATISMRFIDPCTKARKLSLTIGAANSAAHFTEGTIGMLGRSCTSCGSC